MESRSATRVHYGLDILKGPPTKTIICTVLLSSPEIKAIFKGEESKEAELLGQ